LGVALLLLPTVVHAQFGYKISNGAITLTNYTGAGGAVTVPGTINGLPVTSIGPSVFYGNASLNYVTIPNSVTNIDWAEFNFCTSLFGITVNTNNPAYSSVAGVLFNKNQTTLIKFPAGFAGSGGSYTIPASVTSIGYDAFNNCNHLISVIIPTNVTYISGYAFYLCTSLTSITIPSSVTTVEAYAFCECTSLTGVTIPSSVITIVGGAFQRCTGLTSITIPSSVTSIEDAAFENCTSLKGVYFQGNAPNLGGTNVFAGDTNAAVYYMPGTTGWTRPWGGLSTIQRQVKVLLQAGDGGLGGQWTLGTNDQIALWSPMTGPLGGGWVLRAINQKRALLQEGTGGMIGIWDLNTVGVPYHWSLVGGVLPGWIARDLDGNRILLQYGDGGMVGLWTLGTSNTPALWTVLSGPVQGLIASALRGSRVLLQIGTIAGYWTLNSANAIATWTPLTATVPAGWILRSLTEKNILLQAGDGGLSGIWDLDANGQPTAWHMIYGALPGWIMRGIDQ